MLSPDPALAIRQAEAALAAAPTATLVGSSLGGYYALHLAEKHDLRAVLINPAMAAHLDRVSLVGEHRNFHGGAPFTFTAEHQACLRRLAPERLTPSRYLLLVELGDEVLDAQLTIRDLAGAGTIACAGGDHSFTRFAEFLPHLLAFADAGGTPATPRL
jgi:predicted esterase YcpF (UPF0227 family)